MAGKLAVSALPKSDELENLLRFLAFAQIRIGVAEHVAARILSEKDQHAGNMVGKTTGRRSVNTTISMCKEFLVGTRLGTTSTFREREFRWFSV